MSIFSLSIVVLVLAGVGITYNFSFNLFVLVLIMELSFLAINLLFVNSVLLSGDYTYMGMLLFNIAVSSAESAVIITLLILLK